MSFVSGMQRAIKRNLNRIRADKQLSDGWTDWLVKYFPKEAFRGASPANRVWPANFGFHFFYVHFSSISRSQGRL